MSARTDPEVNLDARPVLAAAVTLIGVVVFIALAQLVLATGGLFIPYW
jgi:hypothetical protein